MCCMALILRPSCASRGRSVIELRTCRNALTRQCWTGTTCAFSRRGAPPHVGRSRQAFARHAIDGQPTFGLAGQDGRATLHRMADGYMLTLAGETIRAHVERVEAEALSVERAVAGTRRSPGRAGARSRLAVDHQLLRRAQFCGAPLPSPRHPHRGPPRANSVSRFRLTKRRLRSGCGACDHHDFYLVRNIGAIAFGLYGSG